MSPLKIATGILLAVVALTLAAFLIQAIWQALAH
jgi:hypothetical protein